MAGCCPRPSSCGRSRAAAVLERLGALVAHRFDLAAIHALAESAPPLTTPAVATPAVPGRSVTIAVARDDAFSFYYPENLEILEGLGAEIVTFSPLRDRRLPPGTRGVYLGGGYPELHAPALAANRPLIEELRAAHRDGMPIYAECGGQMYLTQGLGEHEWVGLVPARTTMGKGQGGRGERLPADARPRLRIGYAAGCLACDSALGPAGAPVKGHVFHRSSLEPSLSPEHAAFAFAEPAAAREGYARANLVASYLHMHFGAVPEIAAHWLARCRS